MQTACLIGRQQQSLILQEPVPPSTFSGLASGCRPDFPGGKSVSAL